jgi:PIN domain nuclease of toxin-antitoxin system
LTSRHAWIAGRLPQHHRDPFDRGLIAQALVESVPLVTGDERIRPYTSEGLTVVGVE